MQFGYRFVVRSERLWWRFIRFICHSPGYADSHSGTYAFSDPFSNSDACAKSEHLVP